MCNRSQTLRWPNDLQISNRYFCFNAVAMLFHVVQANTSLNEICSLIEQTARVRGEYFKLMIQRCPCDTMLARLHVKTYVCWLRVL